MRIDVLTIFPEYLAPLDLSLIGKARRDGLLDLAVHDLRDFTHDRHRTVDDTPYGGGAGMVMRPEPWGEALDAVLDLGAPGSGSRPVLLVPSPAGRRFDQAMAAELALASRLVFACGRYEGIDERVVEDAAQRFDVIPVSLGDYVLNGGEVAVLAIVEAVARLIPGVLGNPESLVEESHSDGLLEYPVYTKPASWRGLDVPDVLLSGNHAAIAAWRRERQRERTLARRPDLLAATGTLRWEAAADVPDLEIRPATRADAGEILTLQRACWLQEGILNGTFDIPPLRETLDDVLAGVDDASRGAVVSVWLLARARGRLVGGVRAELSEDASTWRIGRLMVAPDLQGRGLGRGLLAMIEEAAPASAARFELFTGVGSARNRKTYRKAGYRPAPGDAPEGTVLLAKPRR